MRYIAQGKRSDTLGKASSQSSIAENIIAIVFYII